MIFSTCFEQLSAHHREEYTSRFMVFYHASTSV